MTDKSKPVALVVTGKSHTRVQITGNRQDGFRRRYVTHQKGDVFAGTEAELAKFPDRLVPADTAPAPAESDGAAGQEPTPAKRSGRAKKASGG